MATDDNRTPEAKARDQAVIDWMKSWFQGGSGPAEGGRPAPTRSPREFRPSLAAREIGPENVGSSAQAEDLAEAARETSRARALSALPAPSSVITVSGNAQVEQALRITVDLSPDLRADLDYVKTLEFSVPLNRADTGTMDQDAAPQRGPAIGGP